MGRGGLPGLVLVSLLSLAIAVPVAAAPQRHRSAKSSEQCAGPRHSNNIKKGQAKSKKAKAKSKARSKATRTRRSHSARAVAANTQRSPAPRPGFTARAAIVYDNRTGEVLWERNADEPLPPASTTKVLSAAVALQSGRLDESIEVSAEAASQPRSRIGLHAGWQMRLRDLVYAMLLNSANDASVVVAEGVAGSVPAFAARMNVQARRYGATNSHFENPNGLPGENHFSTARDLARVFSRALEVPGFVEILNTSAQPVWPTVGREAPFVLRTHNRLLENYEFRVIGKTGWTQAAGKCFVGSTLADGREVIVAVLGSRNLWGDVRKLIEYGMRGGSPPDVEVASAAPVELPQGQAALGDAEAEPVVRTLARRASHANAWPSVKSKQARRQVERARTAPARSARLAGGSRRTKIATAPQASPVTRGRKPGKDSGRKAAVLAGRATPPRSNATDKPTGKDTRVDQQSAKSKASAAMPPKAGRKLAPATGRVRAPGAPGPQQTRSANTPSSGPRSAGKKTPADSGRPAARGAKRK